MNKSHLSVILIALMVSSLVLVTTVDFGKSQSGTTFQGWQVESRGGQYTDSDNIFSFSTPTGSGQSVILYNAISPQSNFNFSLKVNALTLEGFAIMLRSNLPFAGSTAGVNYQLGGFGLWRWVTQWTGNSIGGATTQQNTWYTLTLSVNQNPFTITASALDQKGNLLGSYTASDMTNLVFNNIQYLGFGMLESGGNYLVTNITASGISVPTLVGIYTSTPSPAPSPALSPTAIPIVTPTSFPANTLTPTLTPTRTSEPTITSTFTPAPTQKSGSQFPVWVILALLGSLAIIGTFTGLYFEKRKSTKSESKAAILEPTTVTFECNSCGKILKETDEYTTITTNGAEVDICKDCMIRHLDKQGGVCPQCKEPLKWNGNMKEFLGEWYHPKCLFELQQGRQIKENTKEVIVKVRCPYCKGTYQESLDKCPHCGAHK